MAFSFEDLKDNITDIADTAVLKIRRLVKIAKLKADVIMLSSEIKKEYRWLGEKCYASLKDSSGADTTKNIENIDYLNSQLLSIREQLRDEKGKKICGICSGECDKSSIYCPRCGNKF